MHYYLAWCHVHRCQHQRTKKRDSPDEKAWKAVVSIFPPPGGATGTVVHHIFFASNQNSSPTAIGRLYLAMNIANAISADVTLSISQPATNLLMLPKRDWAFAMCAARSMWRFTSCLPPWPIPKCVLHATQYAFAALWLLARIPGNVLAHSLSVLALIPRQMTDSPCSQCNFRQPSDATLSCARENNQLGGRLVLRAEHRVV